LFFNFFLHVYVFRSSAKANGDAVATNLSSPKQKDQISIKSANTNGLAKKIKKTN